MSVGINREPRKILELLYWEGQIDPTYLTVDKIREEIELTDANIQDGLKFLHESGFVACSFIEGDARVSEAKISMKGIDKAKSLLNVEN
jgi:DNA-binding transcriptional regulator GbsR (MarR family)